MPFMLYLAKGQTAHIDGRTVKVADKNRTRAVSLIIEGAEHIFLTKRDGTVKHFSKNNQERSDD